MRKIATLFLIAIMLSTAVYATGESVPEFKVIYQSVYDGQENAPLLNVLAFEFNLRIDHVGISVTLNGGTEMIERVSLTEGKRIEIYLKDALQYESEYTLVLEGVKEIYQSQPSPISRITFKTMGQVEVTEENNASGTYYALLKNHSASEKDITFVITAKKKLTKEILDIKVVSKNIPGGGETDFSHTFSDLKGEYEIFAYGFYDLGTFIPLK